MSLIPQDGGVRQFQSDGTAQEPHPVVDSHGDGDPKLEEQGERVSGPGLERLDTGTITL